jgi:hypothetical protein
MRPDVKVFTRDNPCTKKDLWACFTNALGFIQPTVTEAHSVIGTHAPRYMERKGFLVVERTAQTDRYALTPTGMAWLEKGIASYAKNHPAEVQYIPNYPPHNDTVLRRARHRKSPNGGKR